MAFYTGNVAAKDLFTTLLGYITAVQPGEVEAWWKKESSLESDGVYTSTGSTGIERIVLVFREDMVGRSFIAGYARDYTPGAINTAGAFDTLDTQSVYYYSSAENQLAVVSYDLSVSKDRVIIHVQGDKLISTYMNTVIYLGMPIRYDVNDKKCIVRATSENSNGTANKCRLLEDSIAQINQNYDWYYVSSPGNPSWGNTIFLETLHFGNGNEGLRGELDGLYTSHPDALTDGDEIDVSGVRFKVIQRRATGTNSFPRTTFLMRKS